MVVSTCFARRSPWVACCLGGALLALTLAATPAYGHDTGFGHSRRTLYFAATATGVLLEYRVRLEADEALIELAQMDQDGDGQVSASEQNAWLTAKATRLAAALRVTLAADGGAPVPVRASGWRLADNFCQIFLFDLQSNSHAIIVDDSLFAHKHGWARVRQAPGLSVTLADELNLNHAERLRLRVVPAPHDASKEPAHGGQRQ